MTGAPRMILEDLWGAVRGYVLGALAFALLVGGAYCAGHRRGVGDGRAAERSARYDALRSVLLDSIAGAQRAEDSARAVAARATARSDSAAAANAALRQRVVVVAPGQLALHDGAGRRDSLLAVPAVVTDLITSDAGALAACQGRADAEHAAFIAADRRAALEHQLRVAADAEVAALRQERRPRCGARCGAVIGAVATVGAALVVTTVRHALAERAAPGVSARRGRSFAGPRE